jgi:6-phosphogluconolactonase/glucosamine-6-phosphate isomerase/deaminase
VTLTLPALNAARTAAFLVAGEDKRSVLTAVLHPGPEAELPAQRIRAAEGGLRAAGAVLLFTDLLP